MKKEDILICSGNENLFEKKKAIIFGLISKIFKEGFLENFQD